MFNRLKRALVESYVGAIALGYLLAQGVLYFAGIFEAPAEGWVNSRLFRPGRHTPAGIPFRNAVPDAIGFFLIIVVWYILLRWLYYKPISQPTQSPSPPAPDSNPQ